MPQRKALLDPAQTSRWRGVLLTVAAALVFMGLARVVPGLPDHTVLLLLLPVVFAAIDGGLIPGLTSSLVLLVLASWLFSSVNPTDADPHPMLDLLTIGVAAPALALLVSVGPHALLRRERAARTTAELSLRESDATLRTFYDSAPMLMGLEEIVGDDILHLSGNETTAQYFGRTIGELDHHLASELGVAPEHIAEWIAHYRECERSGSPVRFESRRDGPDGPRWYAMTVAPAGRGKEGRVRFVYLMEDVTERRRIESALREAEELHRQFIALASEGVWRDEFDAPIPVNLPEDEQVSLILRTAYLAECNDACARMYGHESAAAMVGARFERFFDLDDPAIVALFRRMVRAGYTATDEETRERDVHGRERWFVNNIIGIVEDGRLVRLWSTQRDITAHKRAEEELRLSQERLQQAQKMEAVAKLTGGIAHDLNNLLTVVLAHSEMLEADLPAEPASLREDLAALQRASRSGATLIRRLLAFSQGSDLDLRATDLRAVLDRLAPGLRSLLPDHVAVEMTLPAHPMQVRADSGALEQVVLSAASNAHDAMPGGGTFRVALEQVSLDESRCRAQGWGVPGNYAALRMSDTGTGMDETVRRRIFEPFYTTKAPDRGAGLGMAVAYSLVQAHKGFIDVASEPGKGTTLTVYLPLLETPAQPATATPAAPSTTGKGTERILLADDEASIRRSTRKILQRSGYTVLEARDGAEAIEILRREDGAVDLVISDTVMPGMGGRELAELVRREYPGLRLILTSGYSERHVGRNATLDAMIPFLHKPWTIADLLARVREVLDAPRAG